MKSIKEFYRIGNGPSSSHTMGPQKCAMAAAAASQLFGGSPAQIEYAAEMGLEHYLGMTCLALQGNRRRGAGQGLYLHPLASEPSCHGPVMRTSPFFSPFTYFFGMNAVI